jgi:hypothetical protein
MAVPRSLACFFAVPLTDVQFRYIARAPEEVHPIFSPFMCTVVCSCTLGSSFFSIPLTCVSVYGTRVVLSVQSVLPMLTADM